MQSSIQRCKQADRSTSMDALSLWLSQLTFCNHFAPRGLSRIASSMLADELLLVVHHPTLQQGQKPLVPSDCLTRDWQPHYTNHSCRPPLSWSNHTYIIHSDSWWLHSFTCVFTNCLRRVKRIVFVSKMWSGPHGLEKATSCEFGIWSISAIDGASA